MSLAHLAIAFFALAAIILLWLGRDQHRRLLELERSITVGMSEADVLAALGPPHEVRREGDPLAAGYFAEHRRETYVYGDRLLIRFERGVVRGVSEPTPLPEVEGEVVETHPGSTAPRVAVSAADDHSPATAVLVD